MNLQHLYWCSGTTILPHPVHSGQVRNMRGAAAGASDGGERGSMRMRGLMCQGAVDMVRSPF